MKYCNSSDLAGALLIPILGLVEVGGCPEWLARIHQNFPVVTTPTSGARSGTFTGNPMGIHWTGIVFGMGALSPAATDPRILVVQR